MDSATHQKTNGDPYQRKRSASNAFYDQDHVNHPQVLVHYVSTATKILQLSSPANNNNNGGLGSFSGCHEPETSRAAAATPVVKIIINGSMKDNTFAFLLSLDIGYRFVPTDQELVTHYLLRKINNQALPKNNKIKDVDIYADHPQKIVENHPQAKEGQWLFFSPRNRKYTNGSRPDRKAGDGYWKATGPDKEITDNDGIKIGDKKSLVYHEGHAPKGIKTDWVMQEFVSGHQRQRLDKNDMKLDDFVLCKIYKKENRGRRQANNVNNQVASDHQQQQSNSQEENPTSVDHGENNVQVIHASTNQNQEPRFPMCMVPTQEPNPRNHGENNVQVIHDSTNQYQEPILDQEPRSKQSIPLPMSMVSTQESNPRNFPFKNNVQVIYDSTNQDQEPRSKQPVLPMSMVPTQEPNPRNFQFKNNVAAQNSLSNCGHPSMGLQNSLSNCGHPSMGLQNFLSNCGHPSMGLQNSLSNCGHPSMGLQNFLSNCGHPSMGLQNSLSNCGHPSMGLQNSLSNCGHPSMGLQNSLSNCDMRFAQPLTPPQYHPFCSGPNYMSNVPHESCYDDTLDFNWPPGYIDQQPLQVAPPPYHIADCGSDDQYVGFSELGFSEDGLNNHEYNLAFDELDHLNISESTQLKVLKHEKKTNED